MKVSKKAISNATLVEVTTETREKGEVVIFNQKMSVENSQPNELDDIITVVTNNSARSRKLTLPTSSIDMESLDLKELHIIQVVSNRIIGVSTTSASFKKQLDFQKMEINGNPIKNFDEEQLYHLFLLSKDASDVNLKYSKEEKVEELALANEVLGIINLPTTEDVSNPTETF